MFYLQAPLDFTNWTDSELKECGELWEINCASLNRYSREQLEADIDAAVVKGARVRICPAADLCDERPTGAAKIQAKKINK